jgi:hypothetical protein
MIENYLKKVEEKRQTMEAEARKTEEQRKKEFDEVWFIFFVRMIFFSIFPFNRFQTDSSSKLISIEK